MPGKKIVLGRDSHANWRDPVPQIPRPELGSSAQLIALSRRLNLDNELTRHPS